MRPLETVVDALLHHLKIGIKKERSDLRALWPEIAGASLSPHTKPRLLPGGTLCVWVDDSSLASEVMHRYQGTLLKRTQAALGEDAVKKIIVRVGQLRPE